MEAKDIVTAVIAFLSLMISSVTAFSLINQRKADRASARSDRFMKAIEHLKDESLPIRMGAIYELQRFGLESQKEQECIVRILSRYIKERIEESKYLHQSKIDINKHRPGADVTLACKVVTSFRAVPENRLQLNYLKANNIDFGVFHLENAKLPKAQLRGGIFEEANLTGVDFRGANLSGANLIAAIGLTAAQLLEAIVDDTTRLDPDLRAEYDRLKAERDKNPRVE